MSADAFAELVAAIDASEVREAVDMVHLQCAGGVCPSQAALPSGGA